MSLNDNRPIITSIFNRKGGTGKTTISVNLAAALARYHKKRVLLIDCDSQGNTTSYIDIGEDNTQKPHLVDYLRGDITSLEDLALLYHLSRGSGPFKKECEISLVQGNSETDDVAIEDPLIFRKLLAGAPYDYVLFDCPPGTTAATGAALVASDFVLVPALADADSLGGYQQLVDTVNDLRRGGCDLSIIGIILNSVYTSRALDRYIIDELKKLPQGTLFTHYIRNNSAAPQCRQFGYPSCLMNEKTNFGADIKAFTDEFVQRAEERNGRR